MVREIRRALAARVEAQRPGSARAARLLKKKSRTRVLSGSPLTRLARGPNTWYPNSVPL